ncbi:hypothetical protein M501DRAFT_1013893 [Patellaria atrata CBS 101060]|uniref:Uncharacterized protein n=1 Tax=Patellaria atrata CBS 101060 TaxID=1346257 RepID=A0A9P4SGM5_9PEZI|nr:hypothetical protein M501DRAFT_1013893 [Patellaria atrata CBS 101060]
MATTTNLSSNSATQTASCPLLSPRTVDRFTGAQEEIEDLKFYSENYNRALKQRREYNEKIGQFEAVQAKSLKVVRKTTTEECTSSIQKETERENEKLVEKLKDMEKAYERVKEEKKHAESKIRDLERNEKELKKDSEKKDVKIEKLRKWRYNKADDEMVAELATCSQVQKKAIQLRRLERILNDPIVSATLGREIDARAASLAAQVTSGASIADLTSNAQAVMAALVGAFSSRYQSEQSEQTTAGQQHIALIIPEMEQQSISSEPVDPLPQRVGTLGQYQVEYPSSPTTRLGGLLPEHPPLSSSTIDSVPPAQDAAPPQQLIPFLSPIAPTGRC